MDPSSFWGSTWGTNKEVILYGSVWIHRERNYQHNKKWLSYENGSKIDYESYDYVIVTMFMLSTVYDYSTVTLPLDPSAFLRITWGMI